MPDDSQGLSFSADENLGKTQTGSSPTEVPLGGGVGQMQVQ